MIGNPPYVQLAKIDTIDETYKIYLKDKFKTSGGRLNTFIFFLLHGLEILKTHGLLGFIIPNTLLTQEYYRETRKYLLEKTFLSHIVSYEQLPFENAVVENISVFLKKEIHNDYGISHYTGNQCSIVLTENKLKSYFLNCNNYNFNFKSDLITEKIESNSINLGSICNINQGIALKGDKKLSLRMSNPNKKYYRVLDGKNINKYTIKWDGMFLDYNVNRIHSCKTKDIFLTNEKLFFRRVSSYLIFSYDNEKYFSLNTLVVVNLIPDNKYNLKFILGVLNSRLMNHFYTNKYKSTKTVFSEIQARSVALLPIKCCKFSDQNKIIHSVDKILENKKKNPTADTTALEREIDIMVYRLYDLTYDEVKIVDPEFHMTKDEYEGK